MKEFYRNLDELYSAGDLDAVEAFIHYAITGYPDGSPECAGVYNELASFYRGISRFDDSEEAFSKSLSLFETLGMSASPEYATVLLNFAGLYRMMGKTDKAIGMFHETIRKIEEAGEVNSYSYISILNNMALAYQEKGEYTEALEYMEKALKLLREKGGGAHEIAASLNNLAAIKIRMREFETADALITEAIALYDSLPETDVHHAAALATKAAIQCYAGDYSGALEGFQRSLGLTERFFGENIEYAICKRNMSDVYEILGNIPAAVEELADCVRVLESILGPEHQRVREAHSRLDRLTAGNPGQ